jgi:hypothetical protein
MAKIGSDEEFSNRLLTAAKDVSFEAEEGGGGGEDDESSGKKSRSRNSLKSLPNSSKS